LLSEFSENVSRAVLLDVVVMKTYGSLLLSLAVNLKQNTSGFEAMEVCFISPLEKCFEVP
jgi:hypothetical protein